MTTPTPGGTGRCPACRGELTDGRIAVPIVGSLRFVYRLGTTEVATEVAAQMCEDCGHVALRGRDPGLIGRARRAAEQARRPGPRRAAGRRSPHGQEQAG